MVPNDEVLEHLVKFLWSAVRRQCCSGHFVGEREREREREEGGGRDVGGV